MSGFHPALESRMSTQTPNNQSAILRMPLRHFMRSDIALQLEHLCSIHSVGGFLSAWRRPDVQPRIELAFETPGQARQAAAVCLAWLGRPALFVPSPVPIWWHDDAGTPVAAV